MAGALSPPPPPGRSSWRSPTAWSATTTGSTSGRAAGWSVFSSLPQPLLAVPALLFVEQFRAVLPVALGFAAGAMVWMVGRDLLPEALAQGPRRAVVADTAVAFALMLVMQLWLAA